jgi:hypothetical protein
VVWFQEGVKSPDEGREQDCSGDGREDCEQGSDLKSNCQRMRGVSKLKRITYTRDDSCHAATDAGAQSKEPDNDCGNSCPESNSVCDEEPLSSLLVCAESLVHSTGDEVLSNGAVQTPLGDRVEIVLRLARRAEVDGDGRSISSSCRARAVVPHVNIVNILQLLRLNLANEALNQPFCLWVCFT